MFWIGITFVSNTTLLPIQQTLTGERYVILTLEPVVRMWIFLFIHYNALLYSSTVAQEYFEVQGGVV